MYITENMIKEIKLKCFQKFNISDLKFEFSNGEMDIRIEGLLGNLENTCTINYKDGEVRDLKISGEKAETVISKAHEIRGFIKKIISKWDENEWKRSVFSNMPYEKSYNEGVILLRDESFDITIDLNNIVLERVGQYDFSYTFKETVDGDLLSECLSQVGEIIDDIRCMEILNA